MCTAGISDPSTRQDYREDPHYTSGTSEVDFDTAYGGARPTPQYIGMPGMHHEYARPGDPGWTGELPHPYSWMEDFKDETNRDQYYSEYWRPAGEGHGMGRGIRQGVHRAESEEWGRDNPPDWHYDKDSVYYDWLPDDMQRGKGSPWRIAEDARIKEKLRIKNEVRSAPGPSIDPGYTGGGGVNLNR